MFIILLYHIFISLIILLYSFIYLFIEKILIFLFYLVFMNIVPLFSAFTFTSFLLQTPELEIDRETCGAGTCSKAENVFPLSRNTIYCIYSTTGIRKQPGEPMSRRRS